jgi:L,D-transpeptidase ErfK/SrfK
MDTDETTPLPAYPPHARITMGKLQSYALGEEDTLLDVARHFRLGFVELRAANPGVDPWTPIPGAEITIPSFKLLPRAPQNGIVVNLAQMRMYYFNSSRAEPVTFPIGIGREGLQTPMGETSVIRKVADPVWYPTDRMRTEKPWLPAAIPAGTSNPLGTHALYLGWPTFLIHGSNKPWAIGRRVSSGCMRMYPEDITDLFEMVPVGTKVTVVDQPILVGWVGDNLYLEANPSKNQSNDIEINGEHEIKGLSDGLKKVITAAAGVPPEQINWNTAQKVVEERLGYPILIANMKEMPPPPVKKRAHEEFKYN